ncbi:hypothetical protein [uncultured Sphingomonas sp.]
MTATIHPARATFIGRTVELSGSTRHRYSDLIERERESARVEVSSGAGP